MFEQIYIYRATLKSSKETSVKFDAALTRYKEMAVNEVNGRSEKITRLKEIFNKLYWIIRCF